MLFLLKLICSIGGTFIVAGCVTAFINWWEKQPLKEERSVPLYVALNGEKHYDS